MGGNGNGNGNGNGAESSDFYQVLGLRKGCSQVELKNAYRKLALRWHPDRCSAFGDSKDVEEAKIKFQAIQQAYSVLSNANKRFLYDIGVYDIDDDDDDENGMADFLSEMAVMMTQNKPTENGEESLKDLFEEMFESESESSCHSNCGETERSISSSSKKRGFSEMSNTKTEAISGAHRSRSRRISSIQHQ